MVFRRVIENDRDWDDDCEGAKYIGQTVGCTCCATWKPVTSENIAEHIASLEKDLAKARAIQAEL